MPIIRLKPHSIATLPHHPNIPEVPTGSNIQGFVRATLEEARPLLDQLPATLEADSKLRPSPPSKAQVKLSQGWRTLPSREGHFPSKEFWVCRESDHEDSNALDGTASWSEFNDGLRTNHAEHEMEYTPSVTSVHQLLNWTDSELWNPNTSMLVSGTTYKQFNIELNLIVHTFHPTVLIRPRAFISWSMSAAYNNGPYPATRSDADCEEAQPNGFITVQVPFKFYLAKPDAADSQFKDLYAQIMQAVPPGTIFARYASVEHVKLLPPAASSASADEGTRASPRRQIRWTMATTSEAAGGFRSGFKGVGCLGVCLRLLLLMWDCSLGGV
ncbi:uncharacterized protein N7515_009966 [Penicillium bovifimosum]|uniref:DUF3074 domain-containing protein n=1 Tax=Penicillium bovifimosum TaxID=126998 RepID=A0A9W9KV01_9EURO|nr:uncharacterized protein N7515_009966 [Penicillium bovifimosum]KAJ5120578.1 hypothetical protein N7515_009966 [Penicillium bovifimosum]